MTLIPLDRKQLILEDAKYHFVKNHTQEQVAASHGITKWILNTWLISPGEEYQDLCQLWIDNILAEAKEEIDNVTDNFPLARENSKWRTATWYAERRDQQRYGGHRVNINVGNSSMSTEEALDEGAITLLAHLVKEWLHIH